MVENMTAYRIANAIKIKDKQKEQNYLIVEGISDQVLFNKFTHDCEIVIAFGNINVIQVVDELTTYGYIGVIGIIDSDFRIINAEAFNENPIYLSDYHDIEVMVFYSNTFSDVLNSYNVSQKLISIWKSYEEFKNHVFELAKTIGYVKLINNRNGYNIKFKPDKPEGRHLDYSHFIDIKTLKYLGNKSLVESILKYENQQAKLQITAEKLLQDIENLNKDLDTLHLCNGHDLMQIIALSLKKNISNLNAKAVEFKQVEKEFILAYDSRFFKSTDLYSKIKNWEQLNNKTILNC